MRNDKCRSAASSGALHHGDAIIIVSGAPPIHFHSADLLGS
jgi:hypothetical protein